MVNTTSSVDAVQVPLLMLQRSVALLPAGIPVTVDVRDDGVVIVAVPETKLHAPVPIVGALPDNVKVPLLQFDWSLPAFEVVGKA